MANDLDLDELRQDGEAFRAMPNDNQLEGIARLAGEQVYLEKIVADLEAQLTGAKERLRIVSETKLPEALTQLGVSEFKLSNGAKITLKGFINVTVKNQEGFHTWLKANNQDEIIKGEVTAPFPKGFPRDELERLAKMVADMGLDAEIKEQVHSSTLRAWAKDHLAKGAVMPTGYLEIYNGFKATIKQ